MSRYAINAVGPSFYAGAGSVSPAFDAQWNAYVEHIRSLGEWAHGGMSYAQWIDHVDLERAAVPHGHFMQYAVDYDDDIPF